MLQSLYSRLAVSLLVLVALLGLALLTVSRYTTDLYSQEVMQRLNASIAMYVTDQDQLINEGIVNSGAMGTLANRVMTINPSVEVYLLAPDGTILEHLLPQDVEVSDRVALAPIQDFLSGEVEMPLLGDDPRGQDSKVFSAAPIMENGEITGYLYAVLGGEKYQTLKDTVEESYILQVGSTAIVGSLALAFIAGLAIFFMLTRRLVALQREVELFRSTSPGEAALITPPEQHKDEVDRLQQAFHEMSRDIRDQFRSLQSIDVTRRELIANVSHDLRTPLASMQGYIETVLIKGDELNDDERKGYLETAHRHSRRLNALISELFELAKLDAGAVEPTVEAFSLMELAHDCVQEFALMANDRGVSLDITSSESNCHVIADISLIQRVLQNLLDNAIRHTPRGRTVTVNLGRHDDHVVVAVEDTGLGIAKHELPHIFDRYYQGEQGEPSRRLGAGLGLAIVKKILDLHESTIRVVSEQGEGTQFSFDLPLQAA